VPKADAPGRIPMTQKVIALIGQKFDFLDVNAVKPQRNRTTI
jgi:hypothetical protein